MKSGIRLIVGLANPGEDYMHTRHNAGAWFVQALASEVRQPLGFQKKYHGLHAQVALHGHLCHLLIPTTFMNNSGQAVQAILHYLKLDISQLLIVHDEIDLPVGVIRLKYDGGDGGHNGLRNIISHINSKAFYRLRIGVGRPAHKNIVDYVLHTPSKSDRQKIDAALDGSYQILPLLMQGEMQKAMHLLHTENNNHGT